MYYDTAWMRKHRDILIKSVKVFAFLAGLALILSVMNSVFMRKSAAGKFDEFYANAQEYDVLFTGISHMVAGVSPMELWNDQGMATFNLAQSGNRVSSNYWMIREALRYSNPKLVVVDVRKIGVPDKLTVEEYAQLHAQLDKMSFGMLKLQACFDLFETVGERLEMLVPFIVYHERWETLGEEDFVRPVYEMDKGAVHFDANLEVYIPECEFVRNTEKKRGDEKDIAYLEKIIEMCDREGIRVLLINIPYLPVEENVQLYENWAENVAEEYGVDYINFLDMDGIVNLDTDLRDVGHLNDAGMKKVTEYLGNYIRENYDIPNHKGDADYAGWREDYLRYTDYKFEMMSSQKRVDAYLTLLADKNVSCCVYVKEGSLILEDNRYKAIIQNIVPGNELTKLQQAAGEGKDYLLVVDRNRNTVMEYLGISDNVCTGTSFGDLEFGRDENGALYMRVNGEETDYLTADWEFQAVAVDANNNAVRNIGRFRLDTVSTRKN